MDVYEKNRQLSLALRRLLTAVEPFHTFPLPAFEEAVAEARKTLYACEEPNHDRR